MISADSHRTLSGDAYLHSDAVFGVKPSLIVTPEKRDDSFQIVYRFGLEPLA
jgi:catechol 1,2-dioxygenase